MLTLSQTLVSLLGTNVMLTDPRLSTNHRMPKQTTGPCDHTYARRVPWYCPDWNPSPGEPEERVTLSELEMAKKVAKHALSLKWKRSNRK